MKKLLILLALVAALTFTLTLTACGGGDETDEDIPLSVQEDKDTPDQEDPAEEEPTEDQEADADQDEDKDTDKKDDGQKDDGKKDPDKKPDNKPSKPNNDKPAQKPEEKPKPQPPEEKPEEPKPAATVGQTLKAAFRSSHGGSALDVANALSQNGVIPFTPMTSNVAPGLLMGFGNTEITGFSDGAIFSPMMGTIPFVGYVFTLDGSVDAATFTQTLKNAADPRWNICTQADETVVDHADGKVFFVMCPTSFES